VNKQKGCTAVRRALKAAGFEAARYTAGGYAFRNSSGSSHRPGYRVDPHMAGIKVVYETDWPRGSALRKQASQEWAPKFHQALLSAHFRADLIQADGGWWVLVYILPDNLNQNATKKAEIAT
jgi:hypothetical protein